MEIQFCENQGAWPLLGPRKRLQ